MTAADARLAPSDEGDMQAHHPLYRHAFCTEIQGGYRALMYSVATEGHERFAWNAELFETAKRNATDRLIELDMSGL